MFFLYPDDARRTLSMKGYLVSVDVVWVDADGRAVEIAERCPPCPATRGGSCPTHGGRAVSRHAVQLAAGAVKRVGLKVGDRLGWDLTFVDGTTARGGLVPGAPPAKGKAKRKG